MKDEKKVVECENEAVENDMMIVEVEKQNKIVAFWKGLKTWQKAAIIGGSVLTLGVGGKLIYDAIKDNADVVADVVEAVAENAAENGLEVTEF